MKKKVSGYFIFEYIVAQDIDIIREIKVLIKENSFQSAVDELKKLLFTVGLHSMDKDTLWRFLYFQVYFNKNWHKITTEPSSVFCAESSMHGLFYNEVKARKIEFQLVN